MGRAQELGDLTVPPVELLSPLASSDVKNPMSCHLLQVIQRNLGFLLPFCFPAQPPLALYICLITSSLLLFAHSGYFLLLLSPFSNDLGSAMLCLHCGAGVFSLSHHVQVFAGLSLSMQALTQGSLVCCIFHHMNEETELCLSFPRLCRTILTWADAFPTRCRRGRKTGVFFSRVICVHLRHCSQAGLG